MLKLNNGKTEFIVFGTSEQLENVTNITVQVEAEFIKPVKKVHNLRFFMDYLMKNGFHVNKIAAQTFITYVISKALEDTSTETQQKTSFKL